MSSHSYIKNDKNADIFVNIDGELVHRSEAKISVFDSSVLLGDGVWDSLRYHNNNFVFLKDHLDRLYKDAKLIDLKIHLSRQKLTEALKNTIKINKMKTLFFI